MTITTDWSPSLRAAAASTSYEDYLTKMANPGWDRQLREDHITTLMTEAADLIRQIAQATGCLIEEAAEAVAEEAHNHAIHEALAIVTATFNPTNTEGE